MVKASKASTKAKAQAKTKGGKSASIDKPKNIGNPRMGWASDAIAELLARMGFPYISLVPGASDRKSHV